MLSEEEKMHKLLKINELNLCISKILTTFIVPNNTPTFKKRSKMRKIYATFNLRTHEREYRHFVALFDSRFEYHYSKFNGDTIVDCIRIEK